MRVWLYYRLSRDEDAELNSLHNQRAILADYADTKGYEIVGESFDDNISGMHFDREGIDKIYEVADAKLIDAVVVKDLSRLGRHKTHTALFIDYLRTKDVRVLSVTENIDTFNENDDLIVGFKGIINDFYARDMSRKIRAGYRQKQKNGMIMTPPMGYYKDKNTGEIILIPEAVEIVQKIFELYVSGYGLKSIAKMLNEQSVKSAAYYQKMLFGKNQGYHKPEITFRHLWVNTGVRRILTNEFYIGTLICHKEEMNKINKTRKIVPPEEQYRHENAVPAIISKELWEQAQFLLGDKLSRNVRAGSTKPYKRYAGLLKCADCGCTFVGKTRHWADNPDRHEYVCNGYHRYGKEHCTPHRIDESTLDRLIYDYLKRIKSEATRSFGDVEKDIRRLLSQKSSVEKKIADLSAKIRSIDLEIENILMERISDKENRKIYDSMLEKRRAAKADCESKIAEIKNVDQTIQKRKSTLKQGIDLIDDILADGGISNTHLRMLIDKIIIGQGADGFEITFEIKAAFTMFMDFYENGELEKTFHHPSLRKYLHRKTKV